uniref:Uncharacterized protein n=1 Tax=Solanum tuberosum TaxID=4113 RepID=M1A4H9_SOLTU
MEHKWKSAQCSPSALCRWIPSLFIGEDSQLLFGFDSEDAEGRDGIWILVDKCVTTHAIVHARKFH